MKVLNVYTAIDFDLFWFDAHFCHLFLVPNHTNTHFNCFVLHTVKLSGNIDAVVATQTQLSNVSHSASGVTQYIQRTGLFHCLSQTIVLYSGLKVQWIFLISQWNVLLFVWFIQIYSEAGISRIFWRICRCDDLNTVFIKLKLISRRIRTHMHAFWRTIWRKYATSSTLVEERDRRESENRTLLDISIVLQI